MNRKAHPMSEESMRQSFISELNSFGITEGHSGESLNSLDYHSVLNLVTIERIKRDYE